MEERVRTLERLLNQSLRRLDIAESRLSAAEQAANKMGGGGAGGMSGGLPRLYIGEATTDITAFSGTTPGVGTVEIYDGSSGTFTATGATKTVQNAGAMISSGKRVRIDLDGFNVWWADPEECETP